MKSAPLVVEALIVRGTGYGVDQLDQPPVAAGRVCHYVPIFIWTRWEAAVVVWCLWARLDWDRHVMTDPPGGYGRLMNMVNIIIRTPHYESLYYGRYGFHT
jgi:hypothetical protein